MVFIIWGFLYGGSSKVKVVFFVFRIVFDRIFDMMNVIRIDKRMNPRRIKADRTEFISLFLMFIVIKIDIIAIMVGNLPLQGLKQLVIMAISFSFLSFIIRHPITPQALQPYPIHIVRACFPWVPHFLKVLSRLKAILGRYPESSSNENKGKKMAIGGSITDITQKIVFRIPFMVMSIMVLFIFNVFKRFSMVFSSLNNIWFK